MADYFVGWDVGGWTCDRNSNSRDSICVLQANQRKPEVDGEIFRGTLRDAINRHRTLDSIVNEFCETSIRSDDRIYMAIDTPLGFSSAFRRLITEQSFVKEVPAENIHNPYIYRRTEEWLFQRGFTPFVGP